MSRELVLVVVVWSRITIDRRVLVSTTDGNSTEEGSDVGRVAFFQRLTESEYMSCTLVT